MICDDICATTSTQHACPIHLIEAEVGGASVLLRSLEKKYKDAPLLQQTLSSSRKKRLRDDVTQSLSDSSYRVHSSEPRSSDAGSLKPMNES